MRHLPFLLAVIAFGSSTPAQYLPPATTGDLLVSSSANNRLLRLAFDGRQLASVSLTGLNHPRGIARARDGSLYVAAESSDEVLVLDHALRLVRRFSTAPIKSPTGLAFGPNHNLYVSGFSTADVGEFTPAGKYLRRYSGGGLAGTNCVAFAPDGGFYAASAFTGRVVRFDKTGKAIGSFTGYGLSSPMGMAIWNGELFVAGGGSNNIVVFDLSGKPLRQLRHAGISGPQGVAFTADGVLVTSSFYANNVSWYLPNGRHVRTVTPRDSRTPRSIAFLTGVTLGYSGKPTLGRPFAMTVESRHESGGVYATALALGDKPGLRLPDGRVLPLNPDPLLSLSLSGLPAFRAFTGRLDAAGVARPVLTLPNLPILRGVRLHAAVVTLDGTLPTLFRQVSAGSSWTL